MADFQAQFPDICQLVPLGTLPSGRKILAIRITDSLNRRESEPRFFYTSTMHGDETAGYPLMLKLIDELLNGYSTNPRLNALISQSEIWINPLANPDGTYRGGNNTVGNASRFNAANVDLNRNFPDPEEGPHPDGEAYQPETRIFMQFGDTMDFVMAANFHGGAEVVNFPWDTWQRRHPDENWWVEECVKFADSARSQAPPGLLNETFGYPNLPGVVQGFDWYEVNGGRQDYMNWFNNCREMTVELTDTKLLPESQINNHWNYYRESLIAFMEASLRGIRGTVRDLCTGKPVRARIRIPGHDKDSTHVYSGRQLGNYHRPIFPGTYVLEVSAPGYQTLVLPGVQVGAGLATVRNLSLQPLAPQAQFEVVKENLCSNTILLKDKSGSASSWLWNFGDGQTSTLKNPTHTYSQPGNFAIRLKVNNCVGSDSNLVAQNIQIQAAFPPTVFGDSSTCGAVTHVLNAVSDLPVAWYSTPAGGIALDTAETFSTPPLPSSTTYFAQSYLTVAPPNTGATDNTIGTGGFFTSNTYHYQIFDAKVPFTLNSVQVYANTTGNRNIQLRNSNGQVVRNKVVNIPAGSHRVVLDFQVPAGEGWQLGLNGGNSNNLFRNSSGASYPYSSPGILEITGNSAGNLDYYYYFYDWEIRTQCQSVRVPVRAAVGNAPKPQVTISGPASGYCEGDTIEIAALIGQATNPQLTWSANGNQAGTGNPLRFVPAAGQIFLNCQLLSADTCAVNNPATSNTLVLNVTVRPPAPTVQNQGGILVSLSGNVLWYLNGIPLGGAANDSLLPAQPGSYTAVVQGTNGCLSLPSTPFEVVATADRLLAQTRIWYAQDKLQVINGSLQARHMEILASDGRQVFQTEIPAGASVWTLPPWPAGLYWVRLEGQGQSIGLIR
jgi:PKD repeat protein